MEKPSLSSFRIHDADYHPATRVELALDRLNNLRQRLREAKWASCTEDADALTIAIDALVQTQSIWKPEYGGGR